MIPAPLTAEEAEKRLQHYGKNLIARKPPPSWISIFFRQFKNPLIYILLLAAGTTIILKEPVDSAVIIIAVAINTVLGFIQEYKAAKTLQALKNILTPMTRVVRDGNVTAIPASQVVPGDIVVVSQGDKIPADGVIINSSSLSVNEAIITGESMPVAKTAQVKVLMGTIVSSGRGRIIITDTGKTTQLGKMAETLKSTPDAATPLQIQLGTLARIIAYVVFGLSGLIFVLGITFGHEPLTMFSTAVAVAVSAVPEGMVVSVTAILALGMQKILKRKALVRKLVSAETLGSVTTICVDKTGTITEGVLKVVTTELVHKKDAVMAALIANTLDDPLDVALWDWAKSQVGVDPERIQEQTPCTHELPFDPKHKYAAAQTADNLYVKGAPEVLLDRSHLKAHSKEFWHHVFEKLSNSGYRILALACGQNTGKALTDADINQLRFLGLVAFSDPLRPLVKESFILAQKAGISLKVITGDYQKTAEATLHQAGITIDDAESQILSGNELEKMTDAELLKKIKSCKLFCRVSPDQKLKIVQALQATGEVVAMTGDGVNDALALKKAEIGIVVGDATDVARETADIVLLDSNIQTIAAAVEEGRVIFDNTKKVVLYLLSDSFTEITLIIASIILGLPLPLTALQILWINIIADGLPNLALTVEPKAPNIMHRKPQPKNASILDLNGKFIIVIIGVVSALTGLMVFTLSLRLTDNLVYARSLTFTVIGIASLFYVFPCRNLDRLMIFDNFRSNIWLLVAVGIGLMLQIFPIYSPQLNATFEIMPLTAIDWIVVLLTGLGIIAAIEITKYVFIISRGHTKYVHR